MATISTKYALAKFSQDKYRFEFYDNANRLSWQKVKAATGCHALINLTYFNMATFKPDDTFMMNGKWLYKAPWRYNGLLLDKDGRLTVGPDTAAVWGYANGEPVYRMNGVDDKAAAHFGANGSTFVGLEPDGTVVLLLARKDRPITSREGIAALAGCRDILRFDGSWSSQGSLGPGLDVDPSQERIVRSYLLVFKREDNKEGKPMNKKVCLDPGHGAGSVNCSPDKSYFEHEFAWDLYTRIRPQLERHGVDVQVTRRQDNKPELIDRCKVSNQWGADLFVSLHSNAVGAGAWVDGTNGLMIYTSTAGEAAARNKAARAILARMSASGVNVRKSALLHETNYTVLSKTTAPAMIIEYGFHTSRPDVALLKNSAYRDKLAVATAKGILDYLGIRWVDEPAHEPEKPTDAPWYAEEQKWVKAMAISDGTRPEDKITRAEVWAMLHRVAEMN